MAFNDLSPPVSTPLKRVPSLTLGLTMWLTLADRTITKVTAETCKVLVYWGLTARFSL